MTDRLDKLAKERSTLLYVHAAYGSCDKVTVQAGSREMPPRKVTLEEPGEDQKPPFISAAHVSGPVESEWEVKGVKKFIEIAFRIQHDFEIASSKDLR